MPLPSESRESEQAKAAEWHAVAIVLLLPLILPPVLMIMGIAAILDCVFTTCCSAANKLKQRLKGSKVTNSSSPSEVTTSSKADTDAAQVEAHAAQVVKLLLEGGTIGRGEVAQSTVSVATTLRYAVLRIAQSFASCSASFLSLSSGLVAGLTCKTDGGYETLPEGADKYIVVEFNAWVYSGVRRRLCVELGM